MGRKPVSDAEKKKRVVVYVTDTEKVRLLSKLGDLRGYPVCSENGILGKTNEEMNLITDALPNLGDGQPEEGVGGMK